MFAVSRVGVADMQLNPNILEHLFKAHILPMLTRNCVFPGAETWLQEAGQHFSFILPNHNSGNQLQLYTFWNRNISFSLSKSISKKNPIMAKNYFSQAFFSIEK